MPPAAFRLEALVYLQPQPHRFARKVGGQFGLCLRPPFCWGITTRETQYNEEYNC